LEERGETATLTILLLAQLKAKLKMAATGYAPLRVGEDDEDEGSYHAQQLDRNEQSHGFEVGEIEAEDEEMERNDEELLLPRPEVRVEQEELPDPSDVEITVDPPSDEGDEPLKAAGGESSSSKAQVSLPWKILVIVYGVLVGDAIASTVITPFVPGTSYHSRAATLCA
jgi:hypothetical protein